MKAIVLCVEGAAVDRDPGTTTHWRCSCMFFCSIVCVHRHEDILQIEQDALEILDMYRDMQELVDQQQEGIGTFWLAEDVLVITLLLPPPPLFRTGCSAALVFF